MTRVMILISFFVISSHVLCQNISEQNVPAVSDFDKSNQSIIKIEVKGHAPENYKAPVAYPTDGTKLVNYVPAYDWSYGSAPTAAAMLAAHYDIVGYPNVYTGTTNNGIMPLDNSTWGTGQCPLSATKQGLDGLINRGHVDDYWVSNGSTQPDPYITNGWVPHTWGNCTGDFMGSNQSALSNNDGTTYFFFNSNGSPANDYVGGEPGIIDGCHGIKQFFISKGYTIFQNFNQQIQEMGLASGFSFNQFKNEINLGRPVLIHMTNQVDQTKHLMLAYGYEDSDSTIYIRDTWDHNAHTMKWGGTYFDGTNNLEHFGVTVIKLQPTYTSVSGTISVNTTWTNQNSPYVITANLTIGDNVTLTIEPGVVIKFQIGNIKLLVNGKLLAIGNAQNNIVFTSWRDDSFGGDTNNDGTTTTPARGNWNDISFDQADNISIMDYCIIRYGGNINYDAMMVRISNSQVNILNSFIEESGYRGIYTYNPSSLTFNYSTVRNCSSHGIENYGSFSSQSCEAYGCSGWGIYSNYGGISISNLNVHNNSGGGIASDGINTQLSYITSYSNNSTGVVCNGAGSTINNIISYTNIGDGLYSAGANNSITNINCYDNTSEGIYVTGSGSTLSNAYSNLNDSHGIYCTGTNIQLTNVDSHHNLGVGVYCSGDGSTITDITSYLNSNYGYQLNANIVNRVWQSDVLDSLNGFQGVIGVTGGSLNQTTQWIDEYQYYVINQFIVTDGKSLFLEPGVVMKFNLTYNNGIRIDGAIVAQGSVGDTIVFTSYYDDKYGGDTNEDGTATTPSRGNWSALYFNTADAGSVMDYCIFRYGGRNDYYSTLSISNSQVSITNSIVEQSNSTSSIGAIYGYTNSKLTLVNSTIRDNNGRGIQFDGQLFMTDCQIHHCGSDGLYYTGSGGILTDLLVHHNSNYGFYIGASNTQLTSIECYNNTSIGIYIAGNGCSLNNANSYYNNNNGIYCTGANIPLQNIDSHHNLGIGVYCSGDGSTIADIQSYQNNNYGYQLNANLVNRVWQSDVLDSLNGFPGVIGITGGTLNQSTLWTDEYQYFVINQFIVSDGKSLFLEPGVVMKFNLTGNNGIRVDGTLVAQGSVGDSIVFTSYYDDKYGGDTNEDGTATTPSRGNWSALYFNSADAGSIMDYCIFRYGGGSGYWSTLRIDNSIMSVTNSIIEESSGYSYNYYGSIYGTNSNSKLTMVNTEIRNNSIRGVSFDGQLLMTSCEIHHCGYDGVYCIGNNSQFLDNSIYSNINYGLFYNQPNGVIQNNYFNANTSYQVYLIPNLISGFSQGNNTVGTVFFQGGAISQDAIWTNAMTYVCTGDLSLNNNITLILEPGCVLKFTTGSNQFNIYGSLVAQGTQNEKIVFTSVNNDSYGGDSNRDGFSVLPAPGDWEFLNFDASDANTTLGWIVVSYAGRSNYDAITATNGTILSMENMIVTKNLDRGIYCSNNSKVDIHNSDIYTNGYGAQNDNTTYPMQAQNNYWGDGSGPYHISTNPQGLGNAVSNNVIYDDWLTKSIDNPWSIFTSPTNSGFYNDISAIQLNNDIYIDLVGATGSTGLKFFRRSDFESWEELTSPVSTGSYTSLNTIDYNYDGLEDIFAGGANGVKILTRTDNSWNWTESNYLPGKNIADIVITYLNGDGFYDIVAACGNNSGIKILRGQSGGWVEETSPNQTATYNKVRVADLNNDGFKDIIATNIESQGIQIWLNNQSGGWIQQNSILPGSVFWGLDIADLDFNNYPDIIASGSTSNAGIVSFLNQGNGTYVQSNSPTSFGIYHDIVLADMNGDSYFDMAAANQSAGIQTWLGNSNLNWNYWYHPIETSQFKAIEVVDMTLDNTPDVVGASYGSGIKIWSNRNPIQNDTVFWTSKENIDFGQVLINYSKEIPLTLTNISSDTLINVVLYTTNPIFQVSENSKFQKDVGPFSLLPGETKIVNVTFSPTNTTYQQEGLILHSIKEVLLIPLYGQGVPEGVPEWTVNLTVANAVGGTNNEKSLTMGTGVGASDTLDILYNEVNQPPLPMQSIFDARFMVAGYEGFLRDIRNEAENHHEFIIQWQEGSGGYPITISWNPASLPDGKFLIHDLLGGLFIDTTSMETVNHITIPIGLDPSSLIKISYDNIYNTEHTYALNSGWNLVSLPVSPVDAELDSIFPNAISAFWFNPQVPGYQQQSLLSTGKGYWLEMSNNGNVLLKGNQLPFINEFLYQGWNLIGTVYEQTNLSSIVDNPDGSINSAFGFNGSYYNTTVLQPGKGYWLEVNQNCQITIFNQADNLVSNSEDNKVSIEKNNDNGYSIPIHVHPVNDIPDYFDHKIIFGVNTDASDLIDPVLGELNLPPWPPAGIFDLRFMLPENNSSQIDYRAFDNLPKNYLIKWQVFDNAYPLIIEWNTAHIPKSGTFIISDNFGGYFIPPIDMRTQSSVIINEPLNFITELAINATFPINEAYKTSLLSDSSDDWICMVNSISPNPFHTSTEISFTLSKSDFVEVKIFSMEGVSIACICKETLSTGLHTINWDGKDFTGEYVNPGIYIFSIKVGNCLLKKKIVKLG